MIRKTVLLTAGLLTLLGLFATPVLAGGADGYAPMDVTATVNPDGSVRLQGSGCAPNAPVTYVVRRGAAASGFVGLPASIGGTPIVDEGSGTADADGNFDFDTNPLPNGRFDITVTCGDDSSVLSVQINAAQTAGPPVQNATPPGQSATPQAQQAASGSLATTGDDTSIPLARLGVILLAAGGVALYAAKKRRGRRAAFIDG